MEIERLNILKGKVTAVFDKDLISDFKKIETSCLPECLFNVNILEDIRFNSSNYSESLLNELLQQFDLDSSILYKNYNSISKSEYRKIMIIIAIITNKPILLLENPTVGLDTKSIKTLIKILKREKKKNKLIIITSFDSEFLFQTANVIIYRDRGKYLICNNKYSFFSNKKVLKAFDLAEPRILEFYSIAKKKKIRLMNRDNINDLIKEIYRNAQ